MTDRPVDGAECDGERYEGPVELVCLRDGHHAQEQEDDAVTGGGKRPVNISSCKIYLFCRYVYVILLLLYIFLEVLHELKK